MQSGTGYHDLSAWVRDMTSKIKNVTRLSNAQMNGARNQTYVIDKIYAALSVDVDVKSVLVSVCC